MKNLRGMLGVMVLLALGLAGCQTVADDSLNNNQDQTVQSATPSLTAVSKVRKTDYLGRWVSTTQGAALYLTSNQKAAWFQKNHTTVKGHVTLKLGDNGQATLTHAKFGTIKVTLQDATTMTLTRGKTTFKLTKDTGWSPKHGKIPTSTKTALNGTSLATPTPLKKPNYQ